MQTNDESLYDILGVPNNANADDIKKQYRKLAMEYHPDKNQGNKDKEERFKTIVHAYGILSDENKRKDYDAFGRADQPTLENIDDLLNDMFSDFVTFHVFDDHNGFDMKSNCGFTHVFSNGVTRSRSKTPDPEYIDVVVSLHDIYHGCRKTLEYDILDACSYCHPSMVQPDSRDVIKCMSCFGKGFIAWAPCTVCNGRGFCQRNTTQCKNCLGNQYVKLVRTVNVHVPKGVHDKYQFILRGKGSYDSEAGHYKDVIVIVSHNLPPHITCDTNGTIHVLASIPFVDLVCGFSYTCELYNGPFTIVCPSFITPNEPLKIAKKGLPKYKDPSEDTGDLYFNFEVIYPTFKVMNKMKPIFEKLFKKEPLSIPQADENTYVLTGKTE